MTRAVAARTNGDWIEPVVKGARSGAIRLGEWARDHPDELAVAVAPWLMVALATRRHKLGVAEAVLISEAAYWGGVAMCAQYRQWKTRPALSWPTLKEVV